MIEFKKRVEIHSCRLTKNNLGTLINLVKADFSEADGYYDFTIVAHLDGADIEDHTLEKFLAHERVPSVLTQLSIRVTNSSSEREIYEHLSIDFSDIYILFSVWGSSETWVNGKFLQIVNFLKTTRSMFWFLYSKNIIYGIQGGSIALLFLSLPYILITIYMEGPDSFDIVQILLFISVFVIFIVSYLITWKYKYTKIFTQEKLPFTDRHKDVITIITITFTVVGAVLAIIQAVS